MLTRLVRHGSGIDERCPYVLVLYHPYRYYQYIYHHRNHAATPEVHRDLINYTYTQKVPGTTQSALTRKLHKPVLFLPVYRESEPLASIDR